MENYSKPWYALDIDCSQALQQPLDFKKMPFIKKGSVSYCHQPKKNMHKLFKHQWLEHMQQLGIEVQNAEIFYRDPETEHPWAHIDAPARDNRYSIALNWCIGLDNAEMVWYHPTTDHCDRMEDSPGSYAWPVNKMTESSRRIIGSQCTMVRIDCPHSIIMHDLPRYCISVRTQQKFDSWQKAVDYINPFIIE
jgi:hypothetical protein